MFEINFDLYKPTELEIWLTERYKENGIKTPSELSIKAVSDIFTVIVNYYEGPCFAEWEEGDYSMIFLNNKMTYEDQRMDFFHELCHPLRHIGIQGNMPTLFEELQEIQASQFQLVAAMPVYLLIDIPQEKYWNNYILSIADSFNLPPDFVERRMKQVSARINRERQDRISLARFKKTTAEYNYSYSTTKILNQLHRQIAEKKELYHVESQSNL